MYHMVMGLYIYGALQSYLLLSVTTEGRQFLICHEDTRANASSSRISYVSHIESRGDTDLFGVWLDFT